MLISFEWFFTNMTLIVLYIFVNNGMCFQGIGGFETFSTVTQKFSCLWVDILVVLQLAGAQKTFSTIFAMEVFFSYVNPLVNVEIWFYVESLSAFVAFKFFFVCMTNLVMLKHISILKTFLTNVTFIRLGRTIVFVIFQTELWFLSTIIATINLFTILPFHV